MGLETVSGLMQYHELDKHYPGLQCDTASAQMHHDLNPTKNFILTEIKMPAIEKMMTPVDYSMIIDTYFYDCMHQMKFLKVTNQEFHKFMNNESNFRNMDNRSSGEVTNQYYNYRERETIDVVRNTVEGKCITYYNSNSRTLGLLRHDYYMGLLLYANYPARDYIRRTPCKVFHPECTDCPKIAAEEVQGWIYDAPPFKPVIEKTFFTYIEENHRLCMGYTVDTLHTGDSCFEPIEPEYYIIDLSVQYFREAIYSKKKWENEIIHNRKNAGEDLYSVYGTSKNSAGDRLPVVSSSWSGPHTPIAVVRYNPKKADSTPADIWSALSNNNMTMLWEADLVRFNARNSAHKYGFNSWWNFGMHDREGWFCGFSPSELIGSSTDEFGADGAAVKSQLTQVGNMFGMDEGAGGSTDSIFKLLTPRIEGYSYTPVVEPLPVRDL